MSDSAILIYPQLSFLPLLLRNRIGKHSSIAAKRAGASSLPTTLLLADIVFSMP
jgi:hypothetical protein